jgi:uncharacterized protein YabE (DUF348 family)
MATPVMPSSIPSQTAKATPKVEKRTITEKRTVPFATRKVKDSHLAEGTSKVMRRGAKGVMTLTYEVTLTDGEQTGKRLLRKVLTRAPVSRVIVLGTRAASRCDPNYSGACVPIASDVDCAGGSGNGPAYVRGPVRVVGTDIYDLDRDGDGIACDE